MKRHSCGEISYITYKALEKYTDIFVLTTTRMPLMDRMGPCGSSGFLDEIGPKAASVMGVPFKNFVAGNQVHSSNIFRVNRDFSSNSDAPNYTVIPSTDGFLTDLPGVPLVIFTADCLPVFLYDTFRKAICVVHAGRKGTGAGITGKAVRELIKAFNTRPKDIVALIGVSIGPCCYPEDLWSENEHQLREEGVGEIINPQICTGCHMNTLYSYRVEKGTAARMLSAIVLK